MHRTWRSEEEEAAGSFELHTQRERSTSLGPGLPAVASRCVYMHTSEVKSLAHCLIASKREKRHPKLYCAEWHKLVLVYVGPETVSREAFIEAYSTYQ